MSYSPPREQHSSEISINGLPAATCSRGAARRRADVVAADHGGLGVAGEVAARGLVEGSAAGGPVAAAVGGRVGPRVAGYGRLSS